MTAEVILALEEENRKLREALSKAKDSVYFSATVLDGGGDYKASKKEMQLLKEIESLLNDKK